MDEITLVNHPINTKRVTPITSQISKLTKTILMKGGIILKLTTIFSSIIMSCDESTKDINEVLSTKILAANMLGMEHFPD